MRKQRSVLVTGSFVITVDSQRNVVRDGGVMIRDGRIIDVDKSALLRRRHRPEIKIHSDRGIILPGLIDCHVHLAQALIRGCADDMALIDWLKDRVWPLQGVYTKEDGRTSALLCMLEMIKSGTTCFLEAMLHARYGFDGIAQALEQSGMRGILSKIVMDEHGYGGQKSILHPGMVETHEASMTEAKRMIGKWNGKADGRIGVWFGPRSVGACSPELYAETGRLAKELGVGITMHLAEVEEDVKYCAREFGKSPVEFVRDVGILGRKTVLAHTVWLNDSDMATLASTGTTACHCPSSNSKLASGIAKVPEMLQAGVNVALGCDGGPSNNTYDMFREMKLAAIIHKARLLDPTVMPAERVLEVATINGAKALGLENEIGSLEVGKKADLIIVDAAKPHLAPNFNPLSDIVYAACGEDVSDMIVDGRVLMRRRRPMTIDEAEVLGKARENASRVIRRSGVRPGTKWPEN